MITYVNTVLVGNGAGTIATNLENATAGQYIIMNLDPTIKDGGVMKAYLSAEDMLAANEVKVGLVTAKSVKYTDRNGAVQTIPAIKWSNNIKKADVKSLVYTPYRDNVPEVVTVDFTNIDDSTLHTIDDGGFCITLRVTYKDLPTRYRKWTDSYEYVTNPGDTGAEIAAGFARTIAKNAKRSRVTAQVSGSVLTLTAMPYDDDDSVDSINWAGQVRFNVNLYYTNPNGVGFTSKNKYSLNGVSIEKTVGDMYQGSAKLVRDRESQAMGYEGILNRGEGTWPIVKPAMQTNLDSKYDTITLEFENMYRAADDIFRKTKQTLEIYQDSEAGTSANIKEALANFANADTTGTGIVDQSSN